MPNIAEQYIDALKRTCKCFASATRITSGQYISVGATKCPLPPGFSPDKRMNSRSVAIGYCEKNPHRAYVGYRVGRSVRTPEGTRLEASMRSALGPTYGVKSRWLGAFDDSEPNFWPMFTEYDLGPAHSGVNDVLLKKICDDYCTLLSDVQEKFR